MTTKYNNVFIEDTYTICGNYENDGPLSKYFDKKYKKDLYFGEKSWEKAETHILKEASKSILEKNKLKDKDIDLLISGDLQNQIAASDYMARDFDIPFIGIYEACATSGEGIILASTFIESKMAKRVIVSTSSHNMASEKQFRNPTEYGTPKPKTATFTTTGAGSLLLSNKKSKIKKTILKIVSWLFSINQLYKIRNYICTIDNKEKTNYICSFDDDFKLCCNGFEYNKFFPVKMSKFEDKKYAIPKEYDYILKMQYGDYMKIPPKEQQKTHNPQILKFEDGTVYDFRANGEKNETTKNTI